MEMLLESISVAFETELAEKSFFEDNSTRHCMCFLASLLGRRNIEQENRNPVLQLVGSFVRG